MTDPIAFLTSHNIDFVLHEHPAVFTCEDAEKHCSNIPGMACKNLLLTDKKKEKYFLLILPANKRADLKSFASILGESKLTFASSRALYEKMGLEPGEVSPFGLLNDQKATIQVYIDKEVYDAPIVSFHPNRNTASLELKQEMFHKYLNSLDHQVNIVTL